MKRDVRMSKAWIAALMFGIALTGCGGSSINSSSNSPGDSVSQVRSGSEGSVSQESSKRTAALRWSAPSQRQNEESMELYELAGYVVSYGQNPEELDQTVYVSNDDNEAVLEYIVTDLADGTWYFSVQAEDTNGLVSPSSELVSKTIQS